jgi:hypothetical protein
MTTRATSIVSCPFQRLLGTVDRIGTPVDKRVLSTVAALWAQGIETSGSCEGHSSHGLPYPWIQLAEDPWDVAATGGERDLTQTACADQLALEALLLEIPLPGWELWIPPTIRPRLMPSIALRLMPTTSPVYNVMEDTATEAGIVLRQELLEALPRHHEQLAVWSQAVLTASTWECFVEGCECGGFRAG